MKLRDSRYWVSHGHAESEIWKKSFGQAQPHDLGTIIIRSEIGEDSKRRGQARFPSRIVRHSYPDKASHVSPRPRRPTTTFLTSVVVRREEDIPARLVLTDSQTVSRLPQRLAVVLVKIIVLFRQPGESVH